MSVFSKFLMSCVLSLSFLPAAFAADDRGTKDQAIAMVKKGLRRLRLRGKRKHLQSLPIPPMRIITIAIFI